ncbi:MAG: HAD family phosphatase [Nitrososphaerota archaeon]|jgi:beta-phosphoglucomutase|nr:HAD family phosphatase [Nitrososphaerota archaeon]
MFEAVIFDWDGTLADTRRVIVISFQRALSENNFGISSRFIERRIGIGAADTFREILHSKGHTVNEAQITRLVERKNEIQIELANEIQLFEGSQKLIESLQSKVKVALASMSSTAVISHLLKINQLEEYFQVVLTADEVDQSKPDPEIFLKTAAKLNTPPTKCVIFEDSLVGVKAAKACGMSCIAVTTGVYKDNELKREKPDLIVKNLKDPQILSYVLDQ